MVAVAERFRDERVGASTTELPAETVEVLHAFPQLRPIFGELAFYDPETFLHAQMVLAAYDRIGGAYARGGHLDDRVRKGLTVQKVGVALHDIGKLLVCRTVEESITFFQSGENHWNSHEPGRSSPALSRERLHALMGGYAVQDLAAFVPEVDRKFFKLWSEIAFGHHELVGQGEAMVSYPRGEARVTPYWRRLAVFLAQVADTTVAMGQPRSYRPSRFPAETIVSALRQTVLSESQISGIFGVHDKNTVEARQNFFAGAALEALGKIQERYAGDVCLHPGVLCVGGGPLFGEKTMPLEQSIVRQVSANVWEEHAWRIEEFLV